MISGKALLFCEHAHRHPHDARQTLLGIFSKLTSPAFPCWQDFTIWLWLGGSGTEDRGKLNILCRKEDEQQWFRHVVERELNLEGRESLFVVFLARRFCFPRPGRYIFRVSINGTAIAEQSLSVTEEAGMDQG
jgi:hypothetical protein